MFQGLPTLSHEQQQQAVERIHQLMADGLSSGQAITQVAEEIRETYHGKRSVAWFDEEEDER